MAAPSHFQTTVGASATVIQGTQHPGYILYNNSANVVYLGGSGVTTGTGFPIPVGGTFSPGQIAQETLSGKASDIRLYGVASGSSDVRVLVPARIDS